MPAAVATQREAFQAVSKVNSNAWMTAVRLTSFVKSSRANRSSIWSAARKLAIGRGGALIYGSAFPLHILTQCVSRLVDVQNVDRPKGDGFVVYVGPQPR